MKVAIIGSSGYVGSYVVQELVDRHELRLIDLQPYDPAREPWVYECVQVSRSPEFIPLPRPDIPFLQGDILDEAFIMDTVHGVDAVIHLSALTNEEQTIDCFRINALGTFQVLHACGQNGVERVLVASSINASGNFYCRVTDRPVNFPYLPVDEDVPIDHEDAYSLSKYVNELNCAAWTNRFGMTTAALRFAGVFPPEWGPHYRATVQPATAWPEDLAGYVDVRDVARGVRLALECEDLPLSGTYQLAAPDTRLLEPTLEIIERFRPQLLDHLREPLPGYASMLSSKRARDTFGYEPQHGWHTP